MKRPKFFLMGYILKFQNLIFMPLHKPLKKAKIRVDALPFTLYIVSVLQGEHRSYLYIFNMVTHIFRIWSTGSVARPCGEEVARCTPPLFGVVLFRITLLTHCVDGGWSHPQTLGLVQEK